MSTKEIYNTMTELKELNKDYAIFSLKGALPLGDVQFLNIKSDIKITLFGDYHVISFDYLDGEEIMEVTFGWGQACPVSLNNPKVSSMFSRVRTDCIRSLVNVGFFLDAPDFVEPYDVKVNKVDLDGYEIIPLYADSDNLHRPYTINRSTKVLKAVDMADEYVKRLLDGSMWRPFVNLGEESEEEVKQNEVKREETKTKNKKLKREALDKDPDVQAYHQLMASLGLKV